MGIFFMLWNINTPLFMLTTLYALSHMLAIICVGSILIMLELLGIYRIRIDHYGHLQLNGIVLHIITIVIFITFCLKIYYSEPVNYRLLLVEDKSQT
jgi:hypothetical protein